MINRKIKFATAARYFIYGHVCVCVSVCVCLCVCARVCVCVYTSQGYICVFRLPCSGGLAYCEGKQLFQPLWIMNRSIPQGCTLPASICLTESGRGFCLCLPGFVYGLTSTVATAMCHGVSVRRGSSKATPFVVSALVDDTEWQAGCALIGLVPRR